MGKRKWDIQNPVIVRRKTVCNGNGEWGNGEMGDKSN